MTSLDTAKEASPGSRGGWGGWRAGAAKSWPEALQEKKQKHED